MASPTLPSPTLPTPGTARSAAHSPNNAMEEVELSHVPNGDTKPPLSLESDIMQCARLGETGLIKRLFDAGKFDAKYADEEGITPLHVCILVSQE